jgi:hypothetical protein
VSRGEAATSTHADTPAEFASYRAEILARSAHQHTLLTLNITALSALSAFVLSDKASQQLLILLPIVSGAVGLLWYDHARNIDSLGDYIRTELPGFDGYERRIAELEQSEKRRVPMTAALTLMFVGAPVAGLVVPLGEIDGALWGLWAVGLVLALVCGYYLIRWALEGFRD